MSYVVAAVVVGVLIGSVRGGSLAALSNASVRWWPLVVGAIALQVASVLIDGPLGVALLLASLVLVVGFTAVNLTRPGMGVVLVGVALNAVVIGLNGGMPVREEAIVAAGIATRDGVEDLDFNSKWHLETEDDRVTFLGDIIPVPIVREVLSFGDLVMAVGVADVIVHLMRPGVRRRGPEASASTSTG